MLLYFELFMLHFEITYSIFKSIVLVVVSLTYKTTCFNMINAAALNSKHLINDNAMQLC